MRLRHRLLLVLIGFSVIATVVMDQAGTAVLRANMRRSSIHRLHRESELIVRLLGTKITSPSTDLSSLVRNIAADLAVRVTVVDPSGVVVADSEVADENLSDLDNHLHRPEIQEALARGSGSSERFSDTLGFSLTYYAVTLHSFGDRTGILRLSLPTARLEEGIGSLRVTFDLMVLGSFLALTGLAYVVIGRVLKPMETIARAADRVASGAYERSLAGSRGGPEIQALAASMDRMRRVLLERIAQLAEQHRLLDTVLSGMSEGLLVVDSSRRVILANGAIRRALALEDTDLEGRLMAEVIRDPIVGETFGRTLEDHLECRRRVELTFPAERVFELLVEPLETPDGESVGAIGIFMDVTRLSALEQVRSTFVADLSHEMRTPLSSVHAAIETLEDDGGLTGEERARFLEILRRNVERIRSLLEDLADLSRIETGAIPLELEPVTLSQVVAEVLNSLQSKAGAAGVSLSSQVDPGLRLQADRRRLDQILINVVENAIKYNRPGGHVKVLGSIGEGGITVRVEDSGEGIPPDQRERVFQRFYRVDRGRSREAGGRGLGLSIVKHLMRMHGGTVRAEDGLRGGTAMVLTFPPPAPRRRPASPPQPPRRPPSDRGA